MTSPPDEAPAIGGADNANALLRLLVQRSRGNRYEGLLHELGDDLGMSATRVSRALRVLENASRVEIVQRGRGHQPSVLRIRARTPLADGPPRLTRPALADRLLEHLGALSTGGVVERPLVDVARALDVGAPSVSRALGRLVEEGLARVDQVGTRNRPTRIALVPTPDDALDRLREENERLVAEVARLRALLDAPASRRHT